MKPIWLPPKGIGDPHSNWTYLVLAIDGAGQELRRSNHAGEQELCRPNRAGEHDFPTEAE